MSDAVDTTLDVPTDVLPDIDIAGVVPDIDKPVEVMSDATDALLLYLPMFTLHMLSLLLALLLRLCQLLLVSLLLRSLLYKSWCVRCVKCCCL